MTYKICLLPGDGIGPEVIDYAEQVLHALPLNFEFTRADIGFNAYARTRDPLARCHAGCDPFCFSDFVWCCDHASEPLRIFFSCSADAPGAGAFRESTAESFHPSRVIASQH